jgi:uncharacterized metal-binding protein
MGLSMKNSINDTRNSAPHENPTTNTGSQTGSEHILIPCCGQANTGQITNEAAIVLSDEGFGQYYCTALLATNPEIIQNRMQGAEKIIAIDGCNMACAKKIALKAELTVHHHIIVTDLGIEKKKGRTYSSKQIKCITDAIYEGCESL